MKSPQVTGSASANMGGVAEPAVATVFRLSVSAVKGVKKHNVKKVTVTRKGIEGDAHAGTFRAISLLAFENYEKLAHYDLQINPGDFGENITTAGLDSGKLRVGSRLILGEAVTLEIVQIGKECHDGCFIKETIGDCVMPREGLFARVITGGHLMTGDSIRIVE